MYISKFEGLIIDGYRMLNYIDESLSSWFMQVRETVRDVVFLHNELFFAAAQKK